MPRSRPTRRANRRSSSWPTRSWGSSARSTRSAAGRVALALRAQARAAAGGATTGPEAWPSDRLQVIAYAALIASSTGQAVAEGRIRYHADNVTVRVPFDDAARAELAAAIATARRLRESTERPPVTDNERLCVRCSLAPVCLPEEVRQAEHPDHEPLRLFPPDRDGTSLHVADPRRVGRPQRRGARRPLPRRRPEPPSPIRELDCLLLHGHCQITTQALHLCVDHDVAVHWLTTSGRYIASAATSAARFSAGCGSTGPGRRGHLPAARQGAGPRQGRGPASLPAPRLAGRRRVARRDAARTWSRFARRWRRSTAAGNRDSLRGLEGSAAVGYFSGLARLINPTVPESLHYSDAKPPAAGGSVQRGPGLRLRLPHTAVTRAILAAGLEPSLGFFHTPRSAAHPLVLDLMELFRVPLWDMVLIGSLNRNQWDPDADFVVTKAKVWLSDAGRKKAIGLFEARLDETWKHPVVDYSLSYYRTIELEARLLEKEWTGEPGLFARMRLR